MRTIAAILIIAAFLGQSFSALLVWSGYALNKEYITLSLCQNRDKPTLHCNGKCHLAKSLRQSEGNQHHPVNAANSKIVQDMPYESGMVPASLLFYIKLKKQFPYSVGLSQSILHAPFHPPESIA